MKSVAAIFLAASLVATPAFAAEAKRESFGTLADRTKVEAVVLSNGHGVRARIIAWGAALQSLELPDRQGRTADVVLSYPDMTGYEAKPQFFGATVGRFANRIAHARFMLDGKRYDLAPNDSGNTLHGGVRGFDKRLWTVSEVRSGPIASVTLARTSPDGEEGYPGTFIASITYALDEENRLTTTYAAITDKPTVVNMSNHSLFNLAGAASGRTVYDQRLTIAASRYTPVDKGLIPTGELRAVAGTAFDFRTAHAIGDRVADGSDPQLVIGRGYDHNWVLDKGVTAEPQFAVRFEDPTSGRAMEIWTTEPGIQFYSGNFLDATVVGVGRTIYRQGTGVALEPQHFPDSPNQPAFPTVRLDPGQTYRHVSVYRFSTVPPLTPPDLTMPDDSRLPAPTAAPSRLRSRAWFDNPDNADMTALYLERYLNFGLSLEELQSGKPIIGIAQTGSDLSPCNRHHLVLAERIREGIRTAGGIALEFPVHPIQETGKRPTAGLDRNLAYLGLVEVLYGYPLDGVVLTTGCDKTTPACLMAAATVNIPAISLSVGPMLNGWFKGQRTGSGTIVWKARELLASGELDYPGFVKLVASSAPSTGFCNTMGTATTMNALAEALGMSLPGSAAIPAAYRDRQESAYRTGLRIVEMVAEDLRPSDILTRAAFLNAIRVNSAIGGSTNAPIHLNALARHVGVPLDVQDWQDHGLDVPLLVNLQPAGEYLGEDFYRAGGVPAVVAELMRQGLIAEDAPTVNGRTIGDNCRGAAIEDADVIRPFDAPLKAQAGFLVLRGNLFDSAIMKLSVISPEFRDRYLSNPADPEAFEGRAVVFDGPEDYHGRIDDPALGIDAGTLLFMRGAGPIGYPGAAEVVNMRPPVYLLEKGVHALPCIGDGRQSGTSGSPSILNASPEAAAMGGLALLRTGDRVRIDLARGRADILIDDAELQARREALIAAGGFAYPRSQTPWQEMQRGVVGQLSTGAVLEPAVKYQRIAQTMGLPRDNH